MPLQDGRVLPARPSEMTGRDGRPRFDSASRAGALAVLFGAAAVVAVVGLATKDSALTWVGLACAVGIAALFATYLIVTERRRHEAAEEELTSEAQFLESLVDSMAAIAAADDVLGETCVQRSELFE